MSERLKGLSFDLRSIPQRYQLAIHKIVDAINLPGRLWPLLSAETESAVGSTIFSFTAQIEIQIGRAQAI